MSGQIDKKKKRVLISGAGGVLGRKIIDLIFSSRPGDYDILALELTREHFPKELLRDGLILYDFDDYRQGKIDFRQVDALIHCAFARSSRGDLLASSLDFTKNLLEDATKGRLSLFVNISSQSVYERSGKTPWNEDALIGPGPPDTFYALAKYASELLTNAICGKNSSETKGVNIRLASLVGEGMDERVVSRFVKSALSGQAIRVSGAKNMTAYLDVDDAADGLVELLAADHASLQSVYNLGPAKTYSIGEIAETVRMIGNNKYGLDVTVIYEDNMDGNEKSQEATATGMDSSKFYKDLAWIPSRDMEAIVKKIYSRLV